jgi:hypothetical protein
MVLPIEAVADAIMHYEGWAPGTVSNRNRNPGNLRKSPLTNSYDAAGFCVFPDLPTGYHALVHDLELKFSGQNTHGLGPTCTLLDLFNVYAPAQDHNQPAKYADFVAQWISHALHKSFSMHSKLGAIVEIADPSIPVTLPHLGV